LLPEAAKIFSHFLFGNKSNTCPVEWYRWEEMGGWSFIPLTLFTDEILMPELVVTLHLQGTCEDTGVAQMGTRLDLEDFQE